MMTTDQIAEAIKLTEAQIEAIGNLHSAWKECRKLDIDFVWDGSLCKIVAVHLPENIEMQYDETLDEDQPQVSFTRCAVNEDEVMMEVGEECYISNEYDLLSWIEKRK